MKKSHLIKHGFKESAQWKLQKDTSFQRIGEIPDQPGVYAISVNGVVKYVGSAKKSLAKRVRVYEKIERPNSQFSVHHRAWIKRALRKKSKVTVLTFAPRNTIYKRKGLPIYLILGLEQGLIEEFKPEFNRR